MSIKAAAIFLFVLLMQGCNSEDQSTSSCAGDVDETYIRMTHPLVTQSDLEAVQ